MVEDITGVRRDGLSVEVVSSERFRELEEAWLALIARSIAPNVFMSASFVSAAGTTRTILSAEGLVRGDARRVPRG